MGEIHQAQAIALRVRVAELEAEKASHWRAEERPPEAELRRRLAAILALRTPRQDPPTTGAMDWSFGYQEALDTVARIARGDDAGEAPNLP